MVVGTHPRGHTPSGDADAEEATITNPDELSAQST